MAKGKAKALKITALVTGGVALFALLAFVVGYFVMLLWNWLMPSIFGLPEVTYWQAWGIFLLFHVLFGRSLPNVEYNHSKNDGYDRGKLKEAFTQWLDERERELQKEANADSISEATT